MCAPCISDSVWINKQESASRTRGQSQERETTRMSGSKVSPFRGCTCPLCTFATSRERQTVHALVFIRGVGDNSGGKTPRWQKRRTYRHPSSVSQPVHRIAACGTCECTFNEGTHHAKKGNHRAPRKNSTRNDMLPAHQHLVLPLPLLDIVRVPDQDRGTGGSLEGAADERVGQGQREGALLAPEEGDVSWRERERERGRGRRSRGGHVDYAAMYWPCSSFTAVSIGLQEPAKESKSR